MTRAFLKTISTGAFAVVCGLMLLARPVFAETAKPVATQMAMPPLWVVEKDGKTLYLFGSIHLLPPQTQWEREEIKTARAASKVFVFEAPMDDQGASMSRVVEKDGRLKEGAALKDLVPPELYAELEGAAWSVQCSPKMFQSFRPWLAAVYLELCSYMKAGFSRYAGVDQVIEQEARSQGAELAYFETVEEQLSSFSSLDRKTEIAYLRAVVRGVVEDPDLPDKLLAAWSAGNGDDLAKFVDDGFKDIPGLRSQLLVARNKRWLPQIKQMLGSESPHFVTVGVGHLVGKDSVVAMLRAAGFKVTGP
ncbi:MAG: TraB/GumN family protein [Alphaproteobacteria bacterium]|nr:TraB/GumN family protein [Alphaproteobacteria bacterium]